MSGSFILSNSVNDRRSHFRKISASCICHGFSQLGICLLQISTYALLRIFFYGGHQRTAYTYSGCSERKCLERIHSGFDLISNKNGNRTVYNFEYFRKNKQGRYRIFNAVVMMGQNDPGNTCFQTFFRIMDAQYAFGNDRKLCIVKFCLSYAVFSKFSNNSG